MRFDRESERSLRRCPHRDLTPLTLSCSARRRRSSRLLRHVSFLALESAHGVSLIDSLQTEIQALVKDIARLEAEAALLSKTFAESKASSATQVELAIAATSAVELRLAGVRIRHLIAFSSSH